MGSAVERPEKLMLWKYPMTMPPTLLQKVQQLPNDCCCESERDERAANVWNDSLPGMEEHQRRRHSQRGLVNLQLAERAR
jgi:hypothetical protein